MITSAPIKFEAPVTIVPDVPSIALNVRTAAVALVPIVPEKALVIATPTELFDAPSIVSFCERATTPVELIVTESSSVAVLITPSSANLTVPAETVPVVVIAPEPTSILENQDVIAPQSRAPTEVIIPSPAD